MKAWVLHGISDLRLEDMPVPAPKAREVLVAVKAAGVCGSDLPRIYKTGAHVHPLIPGHEFSGEVVELGEGTDRAWLGQRVGIFPLIPCGRCSACRRKQYELCSHYSYLGSRRDGGFAEFAAVPEWNLLRLPNQVSFQEAAMLEPMAVAVHAMKRIPLKASDTVAVCGLGTIGLLLVMFLREAGIENIFAIGNKDFQKEMAQKIGLPEDRYCDVRDLNETETFVKFIGGEGADVFFECVGKNETFDLAMDSMAPGGKIVLVGNPYSDMTLNKSRYWKILRNQLTVTGTWNSSFTHESGDDWNDVLDQLAKRQIAPGTLISHRFILKDLGIGLEIMRDKTESYGKVMILEK